MGIEDHYLVDVVAVTVLERYVVELTFDDGATLVRDLRPLLTGPVFQPMLDDYDVFRAVSVDPELGTIYWPNDADIDAEVLRWDDLWNEVASRG